VRFYGISRGDSKQGRGQGGNSELTAWGGSYEMVCRVYCWTDPETEQDIMEVVLKAHHEGSVVGDAIVLYKGPCHLDLARVKHEEDQCKAAEAMGNTNLLEFNKAVRLAADAVTDRDIAEDQLKKFREELFAGKEVMLAFDGNTSGPEFYFAQFPLKLRKKNNPPDGGDI